MKTRICQCGEPILFDDEDFVRFENASLVCVPRMVMVVYPGPKKFSLASVIMNCSGIDHKDRNIHNQQKANLRIATKEQQSQNRGRHSNNTSGYKGVSFHKRNAKWMANITANHSRYFLGYFSTAEEAAAAYNYAAKKHHGEFATLNEI